MKVPFFDLSSQYTRLQTEIAQAIKEVCDTQDFILGSTVERLERRLAEYIGTEEAVGVASGTDAIDLALWAADVEAGDIVITTPFTFIGTAGAIARRGARPAFVDIDPDTLNLDPELVREYLSERCAKNKKGQLIEKKSRRPVKAILPVHLFGHMADMPAFKRIAKKFGLKLIEDVAQAMGAYYVPDEAKDIPAGESQIRIMAGSIGHMGCFSFYPTKTLGAFGDGGAVTTDSGPLSMRLRKLRNHGGIEKYTHEEFGVNSRLDAIQANILLAKFPHLVAFILARRRNAERYEHLFGRADLLDEVNIPTEREGYVHIYNQYVIRVAQRDQLADYMKAKGIGCDIYYPKPLHLEKPFAPLKVKKGSLPEAEAAANETLALPIYPELSPSMQEMVVDVISSFYRRARSAARKSARAMAAKGN